MASATYWNINIDTKYLFIGSGHFEMREQSNFFTYVDFGGGAIDIHGKNLSADLGGFGLEKGTVTELTFFYRGQPIVDIKGSFSATAVDNALGAGHIDDILNVLFGKGDKLTGSNQEDTNLFGYGGNDTILGKGGSDLLDGGSGDDILNGGTGADTLEGGTGRDTASYASASKAVIASLADPGKNSGEAKGDTYSSIEDLIGSSHSDRLYGNKFANHLSGGASNDVLEGGKGVDSLYGGTGSDRFVFKTGDSGKTHASADTIFDFIGSDRIDLTAWDANANKDGVQDFHFIGIKGFTGHAGELHFIKEKSDTWIEGDTNGDKKSDLSIHLDDAVTIKQEHFDL